MTINSTIPYWTLRSPTGTDRNLRECLAALGNHRQRAILHTLLEYGRSLSRADLVGRLLARAGEPAGSRAETAVESSLTHVDLPRLAAARLVATTEESTVRLLEHPLLADPHIEQFLALDETWDDRIRLLAVDRNRLICAILADHPTGLPRDRLAALVAARESLRVTHYSPENSSANSPPLIADLSAAKVVDALHHVHLPALAAAGLVVYDPDAGTVDSSGPDSDCVWQPTDTPTPTATHQYSVDCTDAGIGIRLVVSPDGHVDDAYAYTTDESSVRTVAVPIRTPMTEKLQRSAAASTDEPGEPTSTTAHREQWLIDCWLRHNRAS